LFDKGGRGAEDFRREKKHASRFPYRFKRRECTTSSEEKRSGERSQVESLFFTPKAKLDPLNPQTETPAERRAKEYRVRRSAVLIAQENTLWLIDAQ